MPRSWGCSDVPRIQTMPWVLLPLADPPFPPPLAQLGVSALPWFQRRPQQLTRPHPQRLGSEIEVPKGRQRPAERRRHGNAAGSGASSAAQSRQNLQLLRVGRRGGAGGASQVRSRLQSRDVTCPGVPAKTIIPIIPERPVHSCPILPHPGPLPPSPAFTRRRGCAGRVAASRAQRCPCPSR